MQNNCEYLRQFYETQDKAALGLFFKNYLNFTFRIALYFSKNRSDAEDIVQQVYITILKSTSPCVGVSENDEEKLKGWLAIITANHSKMFLRNKRARKRMLNKSKESMTISSRQVPSKQELSLELEEAIDTLPLKYRVAILMHYKEGFNFSEIGAALEVKGDSVRSLISRGLQKIRKALAVNGVVLSVSAMLSILDSKPLEAAPPYLLEKCVRLGSSSSKFASTTYTTSTKLNRLWYTLTIASLAIYFIFLWIQSSSKPQQIIPEATNAPQKIIAQETKNDDLFFKKWTFDGSKNGSIQVKQGSWEYDSTLKAMSYTSKEKMVVCPLFHKYKKPILMKYKGFAIVSDTEKFNGGAGMLIAKQGKLLPRPKNFLLAYSNFSIPQGAKTKISGINILIGPYFIGVFPSKNKHTILKLSDSLEDSLDADIHLSFNNLCMQELEVEEVEVDDKELNQYIDSLNVSFKKSMSAEDYEEFSQFIKLYKDE